MWRIEPFARGLRRLGSFARVIVFDRRGTGLSDRLESSAPPTLEAQMDDIRAVMDAAGVERAALFGFELGANLCAVFAAAQPSRVFACVLHGGGRARPAGARLSHGPGRSEQLGCLPRRHRPLLGHAGDGRLARASAPTRRTPPMPAFRQALASFFRAAASPGAAVVFERLLRDTDIRDVLPTIQVPGARHASGRRRRYIEIDEARYLAANIPGARLLELEGADHYPLLGRPGAAPGRDRAVPRRRARSRGRLRSRSRDRAVHRHRRLDRDCREAGRPGVARPPRRRITSGSGPCSRGTAGARSTSRATDSSRSSTGRRAPSGAGSRSARTRARWASRCGSACTPARWSSTGRPCAASPCISALASGPFGAPGEVLCSSTVKDLVAGSGLRFESRGEQRLKGVPEPWHLYAASAPEPGEAA